MVAKAGKWSGGRWETAPAILAMVREADRLAANRRRNSDGTIGDPDHQTRKSNHNPQESGEIDWVDAGDITHDPANGMDIHAHARAIVARQDPRFEEIISNRQIWTYARRAEGWRPYTGTNPHVAHAHFTVRDAYRHDLGPFFGSVLPFPTPGPPPYFPPPARPPAPAPAPVPQPAPSTPSALTAQEADMFLLVDGVGIFAVIDGVPIALTGGLAEYAALRDQSPGTPTMVLPTAAGQQMLNELLKKHAKAIA